MLKLISSWISGDALSHYVYEPEGKVTVNDVIDEYGNAKILTVGFQLVNKERKPIVPAIHYGKDVIRPGVWDKKYYKKRVKKVYETYAYTSIDFEIEVEEDD